MRVRTFPVGQMQTNCYLIIEDESCLILDPGDNADRITEELQRGRFRPQAIIATHGHFDHIMGVGELQQNYDIPWYLYPDDQFLVDRVQETAQHFLDYNPAMILPRSSYPLQEGDVSIPPFTFHVIPTPGHTPGGCALYFKDEGLVFVGDTIFHHGIGRYDFSYSDKQALDESIRVLLDLPGDVIMYPGHGPPVTVEERKHYSYSA